MHDLETNSKQLIIYITELSPSVIQSQVVELLTELQSVHHTMLEVWCGVNKNTRWKLSWFSSFQQVRIYRQLPGFRVFDFLQFLFMLPLFLKARTYKNNYSSIVLHMRSEKYASAVHFAIRLLNLKVKVLYDIRGAVFEEQKIYGKQSRFQFIKSLKLNYLKSRWEYVSETVDAISTVSPALSNYVLDKLGSTKPLTVVIPCLAGRGFVFDKNYRDQIRASLGLNEGDFLLVVSSGGNATWQSIRETLEHWKDGSFKVLNLSRTQFEHPNVISLFVDYSEMPMYLSSADIALFFRDSNTVNKVASPVKISEYLCCGLPIITDRSCDAVTDYISQSQSGLIVDSAQDIYAEHLIALRKKSRRGISIEALKVCCLEVVAAQYAAVYKELRCYSKA